MNEEEAIRYLVRDELRKILDKGLMYSAEVKPQPKEELSLDDVAKAFPEDLRQHLTITPGKIKTKFVARELFLEMDKIAKSLGYEYVSAGKESHWSVVK